MKLLPTVDWPVPVETQRAIMARLVDVAKGNDRNAIAAGRVIVSLRKLDIQQQMLDLRRKEFELERKSPLGLVDLIGEAEQRARQRTAERGLHAKATK
jgi:hypothetical protein